MAQIPDTDYQKVGDSAFTNGNVISYEGENYYRACNYLVKYVNCGGSQVCATCKRESALFHHPSNTNQKVK